MNTAHITAIFVWAIFSTCALSASLLSWLTNLSPPIHDAVESVFVDLSINLGFAIASFVALLVSLAILLVPTWRAFWRRILFADVFVSILWMVAVGVILVFCFMSEWHPCSVMSQLQVSLHPEAIPGAIAACRKLMALDILAAVNLLFSEMARHLDGIADV
ncbi:hypothetical protein GALMADRAFT_1358450 [Galerina marginata CBS 339.88]|uniref:Uncharacterized protein n=1 Tax=Galerina marginata (strain CBS 339.88) TaxID=685588 RepID=A0A067TDJ3_GALM3|nr:hypothetical protein GALMADRAFT_1358450 [Galerina marginata CBS 339.88]